MSVLRDDWPQGGAGGVGEEAVGKVLVLDALRNSLWVRGAVWEVVERTERLRD